MLLFFLGVLRRIRLGNANGCVHIRLGNANGCVHIALSCTHNTLTHHHTRTTTITYAYHRSDPPLTPSRAADMWVDGVDAQAYADFLHSLLCAIAVWEPGKKGHLHITHRP